MYLAYGKKTKQNKTIKQTCKQTKFYLRRYCHAIYYAEWTKITGHLVFKLLARITRVAENLAPEPGLLQFSPDCTTYSISRCYILIYNVVQQPACVGYPSHFTAIKK